MDQIAIQLPKTRVSENTTFPVTAYFRTRATKAASAPTTVHYRIDCLSTHSELQDWTEVATGENVTITISSANNAIQQGTSRSERKQIIIQADRGLSTQVVNQATWLVNNILGIR
jgi:hypothetical protein